MAFKQIFLILSVVYVNVNGHGMLWEPPNRSSLWKFGYDTPINYNDNQNFCGGFQTQFEVNGGKCGICGDDYREPLARDNELGGKYGTGIIPRTYLQGTNIPAIVRITANHLGYFTFDLCNLDGDRETEECFEKYPLKTIDGHDRYYIDNEVKDFPVYLTLPPDVVCEHCVLRWQYTSGNNWGVCPDGTGKQGCGPQETFRTCSDIKIIPNVKGGQYQA